MSSSAVDASSVADGDAKRFAHFKEICTAFQDSRPDVEGELAIPAFLNAMKLFLRVFDALGGVGDLVKKDIEGNIMKLGKAASEHGCASVTAVVKRELSDSDYAKLIRSEKGKGCDSGTVATLWMKRTIQFVSGMMQSLLADPDSTLADAARKSYAETLSLAHPWVTRRLFDTALRFAPARATFYKDLGGGSNRHLIESAIQECFDAMGPVLTNLIDLYKKDDLETLVK